MPGNRAKLKISAFAHGRSTTMVGISFDNCQSLVWPAAAGTWLLTAPSRSRKVEKTGGNSNEIPFPGCACKRAARQISPGGKAAG
jgi:hypothetical protein